MLKFEKEKKIIYVSFYIIKGKATLVLCISRIGCHYFDAHLGGGRLALTMDQGLKDVLFFYTMIALAATVILHGLITRPGKAEITIWVGLSAIFLLLYSRLTFAERGHLFEYSVLAIFIHKALMERAFQGRKIHRPALLAFLIVFAIGALDEFIQLFLPSRVFDIINILFNGFAAFAADT